MGSEMCIRDSPITLQSRGYAYLRAGEPALAIADYDAALAIAPNLDAALFGRGIAHAAAGNRNQAAADLAAARALNPGIDRDMAKIHIVAPADL